MVNILYLSNTGSIIGGGEISLISLLTNLDRTKYNPVILTHDEGTLTRLLKEINVPAIILPWKKIKNPLNILKVIKNYAQLKKIISDNNIHIIHCNTCGGLTTLGALAARRLNIPFIWHVRTQDSSFLLDIINAWLSTSIVVISQTVRLRFAGLNVGNKIIKIYNGVDVEIFQARSDKKNLREEIGCPNSAFLITAIGRFHPIKGYHYLIKAAKIIAQTSGNSFFLIVGMNQKEKSNYMKKLIKLAKKLGIEGKIRFLSARKDITNILSQSDIFVLPSPNEAFGRSLVEAMACQKPIVAFNSAGPKEIIKDKVTGLLAKSCDANDLALKIKMLISDSLLRQTIAANARQDAMENYSIKKHTQNIELLYKTSLTHSICNICHDDKAKTIESAIDYRVVRCNSCGLIRVDCSPSIDTLAAHYNEEYYQRWITVEAQARNKMWERRLKKIVHMKHSGNKLLDIGAGPGIFLNIARNNGWDVTGTEISGYSCAHAKKQFNIDLLHTTLHEANFPDNSFDVITMWHVLEHTTNPKEILQEIKRILKPNGLAVIAVPNINCLVYNFLYSLVKLHPPKIFDATGHEIHLYHFSEKTLTLCARNAGLKIIKTAMDTERIAFKEKIVEYISKTIYSVTKINLGLAIELYVTKEHDEQIYKK